MRTRTRGQTRKQVRKQTRKHTPTRVAQLAVAVSKEGVTVPLSTDRVRDIVRAVCRRQKVSLGMISVTFVTSRIMAKMNREYLGHHGPTDIITFELESLDGAIVGDVYIAPDVARANAAAHGVGIREELTRLVVHGTLHVLGHTHPEDDHRTTSPMWRLQERLVASLA